MKKNAMLKIAAILMVAVLLTTCAISSTFAKYSTTGQVAATEARVAKWGITVNADATNKLFGIEYGANAESLYVDSEDDALVVAPGTTGSAPSFTIGGTAEVDVNVTATANVELANWYTDTTDTNTLYCPLVVTVAGTELTIDYSGDKSKALEEFEADIEAAIVRALTGLDETDDVTYNESTSVTTIAKPVAANQRLGTTDVAVSWEWALGEASTQDTALGTNATDAGKKATISIEYGVTVEQVGATPDSSPVFRASATP